MNRERMKTLCGLLAALLLALSVCGAAAAEEADGEKPAWTITRSAEMTEDALAAFHQAAEKLTDGVYEPVALLGEQGDVYCILCRVSGENPETEPYYTLLYVGAKGVQNSWDLWIEDHSQPRKKEKRVVTRDTLLEDLAAVQEAEAQLAGDMQALQDDEMAAFLYDRWQEIYTNPEYRLYLDGQDDPAELPVHGRHAFVILGFELENGAMREELKARCDAAAAAARAFPDSVLVCSGGATGENNPENHTEAGLMKAYLAEQCGIAEDRILTDETAMTTTDNAVNTFAILKDRGIETYTVVTSSYHQRRANMLYATLAELIRKADGFSVTAAGNYGCAAQAPENLAKNDARITVMQIEELISRFQPEP